MKIINDMNFPEPFMKAIENDDYDMLDATKVSVTTLIDSPYIWHLKNKHKDEITVKASQKVRTLFGSSVHYMLERVGSSCVNELRLEQEFNGMTISGKLDLWDPKDHTLWDYKTAGVDTYCYNKDGKQEWIQQLNINKWLMDSKGIPVTSLKVLVFFIDWKASKLYESNYPPAPIIVLDVPIWDWNYLTKFLRLRTEAHKATRNGILTPCDDRERWQKKPKFACNKPGATRATRVFDTQNEALLFCQANPANEVTYRQGSYTRCEGYCDLKPFCSYYASEGSTISLEQSVAKVESTFTHVVEVPFEIVESFPPSEDYIDLSKMETKTNNIIDLF